MRFRGLLWGGAAVIGLALPWGAAAQTFQVGVFFDTGATVCSAEVRNNAPPVRAYVYAVVPAGTEVNGGLLRLVLPHAVFISDVLAPKDGTIEGSLTASTGLDVILAPCQVADGPVLLASFNLHQFDETLPGGARVPDLLLEIKGGVIQADSLSFEKPQVKLCPEDPVNGEPVYVQAAPIRSMLNCDSDCPCVTPLRSRTWADVKHFFRGR